MKLSLYFIAGLYLSACASSPDAPIDVSRFSHTEISKVVSTHFDTPASAASQALRPSFKKFGAPKHYVSGNMSGVHDAAIERLYGLGDIHSRLALAKPVYWQIDGEGLAGDVAPIATVHLIYDEDQFDKVTFASAQTETRRGHNFTVFERKLGAQIIVSVYPTERLSKEAEFKTLIFETR